VKKCIPITEAQEGMTLAKSVTGENGMTLCVEGTVLTQRLINRFEQMEIVAVTIETGEEMTEEEYVERKKRIERRFSAIQKPDSFLAKVKKIVLERLESEKGS